MALKYMCLWLCNDELTHFSKHLFTMCWNGSPRYTGNRRILIRLGSSFGVPQNGSVRHLVLP